MNYFQKQCFTLIITLMTLLSTKAAAIICDPKPQAPAQSQEMALTLCESDSKKQNLSTFTASWPASGILSESIPFQIRSCGDYGCNRATRFSLRSNGVTLTNGSSEIPLTVTAKQVHTGAQIPFPDNRNCVSGTANCPFQGAGRQTNLAPDYCESCVDFELLISVDLNALLNSGKLTETGIHTGTLTFRIDQANDSSNTGSGDSGHERDVDVTIQIDIPDLLQISGLSDMTLSKNSSVDSGNYVATQTFCVYRLKGGRFEIKAEGTGASTGDDFQLTGAGQTTIYEILIGRTGRQLVAFKQGSTKARGHWRGDCSSYGNNLTGDTNMTLEARINKANADGLPSGVYKDTMTLTVMPK